MKKLLTLVLVLSMCPTAVGQISLKVYEADGVTPFDCNDDIMVGTQLTLIVSSDSNDYWSGGLFIAGQDRELGTLAGRDWDPNAIVNDSNDIIGKSVYDIAPKEIADKYYEKDLELFNNPGVQVYEYDLVNSAGEKRIVVFHKAAFLGSDGQVGGLIGTILDITDREKAAADKERLIKELQEALDKVKLLSGFIPICASCKKIRDDKGYWQQVEEYIREHSEAEFSHGICPDCAKKLYPEFVEKEESQQHG